MTHSRTTRRSKALFGVMAAAALSIAVTDSAQAGKKELNALAATLAPATVINATPQQLADAVAAVIQANPKFKVGVVAGEALKTPAAISGGAGDEIANAVLTAAPTQDIVVIAGDAAKTAGTGKESNASQVDDFAAITLTTDAQAIGAAERAKKSKLGAGAIIQGRSSVYATDAEKISLANSALDSKKLLGLAMEVSAGASVGVANPREFAVQVTNNATGSGVKIAPGVVSTHPESAATIVEGIYTTTDSLVVKQVSVLAKNVAAVADIEQISNVALVLGRQIGGGSIKTNKAAGLAKTLVAAIVAKSTVAAPDRLSLENKADEVAEIAAFIVAGLSTNSTLTAKSAPKIMFAIVKNAIKGGKANVKKGQTALPADYIDDLVGSVATTVLASNMATDVKTAIQSFLNKKAKAIAGKANESAVAAALAKGFDPSQNSIFEDGMIAENNSTSFVIDPETDDRGFDAIPNNQR